MEGSVREKLVVLLDKVCNSPNPDLDVSSIDTFCCFVRSDPSCAVEASKLFAERIQSGKTSESLNSLYLLEECMAKCGEGHRFQATVNTFRFLNELVKLVSPKYLASTTNSQVKNKILDLLLLWTVQYPKEAKIKEAYDMLRRQGVVHASPNPITIIQKKQETQIPNSSSANQSSPPATTTPCPPTDPTSLKIKQLVQSKNPDRVDIHAANLLIQNFYEIEKRKTLRVQEIKRGRENVALLDEMIDNFSVAESSSDDIALMRELYENCKSLQPTVLLLAEDPEQEEQVMQEALETNDVLLQVLDKYHSIVVQGNGQQESNQQDPSQSDDALIDMSMSPERANSNQGEETEIPRVHSSVADPLEEIFGSLNEAQKREDESMALLPKAQTQNMISGQGVTPLRHTEATVAVASNGPASEMDSMISEMLKASVGSSNKRAEIVAVKSPPTRVPHDFSGISVDLEVIQVDTVVPPRPILDEPQGVTVILTFTKECPKEGMFVMVVTVANRSLTPVEDIQVSLRANGTEECEAQVVDSKGSNKRRDLSGVKRFSSAVDDLSLIALVSNPRKVVVPSWEVVLTYRFNGQREKRIVNVIDLPL